MTYATNVTVYGHKGRYPPPVGFYEVACTSGADVTADLVGGVNYYIQVASSTEAAGRLIFDVVRRP